MAFSREWFKLKDPRWSWARPSSAKPPKALCLMCNIEFYVQGKMSFTRHAISLRHKAFKKQVLKHKIVLNHGANSIKNLKPSEIQVEILPKSKEGKPTGEKRNSKKTTQDTLIPTNEILELEEPSSQLNMNLVRTPTHNSHFDNLQNEEEDIILLKTEPASVNFISAINRIQVSNYGIEIEGRIQRLMKEIEILQNSIIEKAELCEVTGNISYVIESNTFRRITEEKIQELANANDLLRSINTN